MLLSDAAAAAAGVVSNGNGGEMRKTTGVT